MDIATPVKGNEHLTANGIIEPWPDGSQYPFFGCPWLRAFAASDHIFDDASTLIILQDWGCVCDEIFEQAVESVKPFFERGGELSQKAAKDTTLRNLWAEISAQTQEGKIAVTNAVWGLRPEGVEITGYLGSVVHKAWFGNLLNKVIVPFLKPGLPEKKIIFCGEWARDWGAKESTKLSGKSAEIYIQKYAKWTGNENYQDNTENLKDDFQIYFFRHPSASGSWCPRSKSENDLDFEEVDGFEW